MKFENKPDVFDILLPVEEFPELQVGGVDTGFGIEGNSYLLLNNLILGEAVDASQYYSGLRLDIEGLSPFGLSPALQHTSETLLPTVHEFCVALEAILNKAQCWVLICERDCDQHDLEHFN